MTKYRICISLLSGLEFTSLVCLLLNIPVANFFPLVLFIPGGIASRILPWSANWVSISILLGANVVIYSVPVFILILPRFTTIELETLQEDGASHGAPSGINVISCLLSLFKSAMAERNGRTREARIGTSTGSSTKHGIAVCALFAECQRHRVD